MKITNITDLTGIGRFSGVGGLNLLDRFIKRVDADSGILYSELSATDLFDYLKTIPTPLLAVSGSAGKTSKLYSMLPENGDGDFAVVRSGNATVINSSRLIENVGANIPRIDYLNNNPVLLVEPLATNLFIHSENVGGWPATRCTYQNDAIIAPDSTLTADKLIYNDDSSINGYIGQSIATSAQNYTISFFAKKGSYDKINCANATTGKGVGFDLTNGTTFSYLAAPVSSSIVYLQDGWYKCRITVLCTNATNVLRFYLVEENGVVLNDYVYLWGMQLEAGNMTSYIKTTTVAAPRNADVITVTPPENTNKITEFFEGGATNDITVIPETYQIGIGRIEKVVFFSL